MKNGDYVSQVDEMDCGAACLAMILKHYKSTVSILDIVVFFYLIFVHVQKSETHIFKMVYYRSK